MTTEEFDLRPIWERGGHHRRLSAVPFLAGGGLFLFLGAWAATGFFQAPPDGAPQSVYDTILSVEAVPCLAAAAIGLGVALAYLLGEGPDRLVVRPDGFEVVKGKHLTSAADWSAMKADVWLTDLRDAAAAHPKDFPRVPGLFRGSPSLCAVREGASSVWVPEAGFEAILRSARNAGREVRESSGGYRSYPETRALRVVRP